MIWLIQYNIRAIITCYIKSINTVSVHINIQFVCSSQNTPIGTIPDWIHSPVLRVYASISTIIRLITHQTNVEHTARTSLLNDRMTNILRILTKNNSCYTLSFSLAAFRDSKVACWTWAQLTRVLSVVKSLQTGSQSTIATTHTRTSP